MSFLFLSSSFFLDWNVLVWSSNSNCEEVRSGGLTSFLSFVLGIKSVVFAKFSFASRTTSTSFEVFFVVKKRTHKYQSGKPHSESYVFRHFVFQVQNASYIHLIWRYFPTTCTECILLTCIRIMLHFAKSLDYIWLDFFVTLWDKIHTEEKQTIHFTRK